MVAAWVDYIRASLNVVGSVIDVHVRMEMEAIILDPNKLTLAFVKNQPVFDMRKIAQASEKVLFEFGNKVLYNTRTVKLHCANSMESNAHLNRWITKVRLDKRDKVS